MARVNTPSFLSVLLDYCLMPYPACKLLSLSCQLVAWTCHCRFYEIFPIQVFKSELLAVVNKVNITMMALQEEFVKMFNQCSIGEWSLWYCAGKGDWKHKVAWLCESRSYSSTAVCRRCNAQWPSWADVTFCTGWYTNQEQAVESAIGDIP